MQKDNDFKLPEITERTTPMMKQYLKLKRENPQCLLFFRLGDFYELFFEDAIIASEILNITLTRRGQNKGEEVPMCGIPYHAYEAYMPKLINANKKIAICDQMESPEDAKKRGASEIVKREVVRIITPGTLTEDDVLKSKDTNYLMSIIYRKKNIYISWVDISTGEFYFSPSNIEQLNSDIDQINPKEILISEKLFDLDLFKAILSKYRPIINTNVENFFEIKKSSDRLKSFFKIETLDAFEDLTEAGISACGSLLEYISITQKGNTPRINAPKLLSKNNYLIIDSNTRSSLELFSGINGDNKNSLFYNIDHTITSGGGRVLLNFLSNPIQNHEEINERLDIVSFFIDNEELYQQIDYINTTTPDIERSIARIAVNREYVRDLSNIKKGIENSLEVLALFTFNNYSPPQALQKLLDNITSFDLIIQNLNQLNDNLPMLAREGNIIKEGFNPRLDNLRQEYANHGNSILTLEKKYRELTKVPSLKIGKTNILGYYIEVKSKFVKNMNHESFIHKQTLSNNVRYITQELVEAQQNMTSYNSRILELEMLIYDEIKRSIMVESDNIVNSIRNLYYIDVYSSFAKIAIQKDYVRPIVDNSNKFTITQGRHPIVENNLNNSLIANQKFHPNNCELENNQRIWLITGPNMGGKSTFLRQNAIISILAHIGCYVPANSAHIGIIDRIFSRIGASDNLAMGKSTFMVEMIETAIILNNATEKSLIILDEIGRGTATYDGMSIAWSVLEHLEHTNKSKTLFATHYHELTKLSTKLNYIECYYTEVKEWKKKIIFMYNIKKGTTGLSYGINVAQIAGVPINVIKRAQELLLFFEQNIKEHINLDSLIDSLPLFNHEHINQNDHTPTPLFDPKSPPTTPSLSYDKKHHEILEKIQFLDLENMTPNEALNQLHSLQNSLKD